MLSGINLSDRNAQIALGLGAVGVAAGAALLSKKEATKLEDHSHCGHCCASSSMSSLAEEPAESKSIFSYAYDRVFGSAQTESTSSVEFSELEAPIEIETEAVTIDDSSKKTLLGNLGLLAKALVLLPFVIVASMLKGLFSGMGSFFSSLFGKSDKVSAS